MEHQRPAHQLDQLAADSQSQSGAAILAAGAGIGLAEGIKNECLLVLGNPDAGVFNLKTHMGNFRILKNAGTDNHMPPAGKLDGVSHQVDQALTEMFGIGHHCIGQVLIGCYPEGQALAFSGLPHHRIDLGKQLLR